MRGTKLLCLPVIAAAGWAVLRLCGLPGTPHLTAPRLFLILLTAVVCVLWTLLYTRRKVLSAKPGTRSLIFYITLAAGIAAVVPLIAQPFLPTEGFGHTAAAFIEQAAPFLVFLLIASVCAAVLLALETGSLRPLLTENTFIPELALLFIVSLLLFGAFFPLRANYYPSHDYAIFSYIGQQILQGRMPYTELWDHKPPVIFYIDALGLKLAGGSLVGIWALEFIAFFLGLVILLRVLKKFFPGWIALTVLCLGALHYVRLFDFGNYCEEFSLFFAVCALGLYFLTKRGTLSALGFGILGGLAFTCKQNTVGVWAALFLIDLCEALRHKDLFRGKLRFWLLTAAGFLAVNAAWCAYFAANGALAAYWDVAFRFNFVYSEKSGENRLACALTTLTFLPTVSPFLLIAFLAWVWALIRRAYKDSPLTLFALVDLPIELICAGLSGMNYQHYFILCVTPALILLCALVRGLETRVKHGMPVFRAAVIALLFVCSLTLVPLYIDNYTPRAPSAYTKARDYLVTDTDPANSILVWGSRSAIYVMSERRAPTAYFNERPLYLFAGEEQKPLWDELLADMEADPPEVVIDVHDSALPFVTYDDGRCEVPSSAAEWTKSVYQYFCDNYAYDSTINEGAQDAWEVYRRREINE